MSTREQTKRRGPAYKAFISYSHAADNKLAPALQSGLQQFARPWNQMRAIRVFRDETGLGTTPALWPSIEAALNEAEYFILLASPQAAQSKWVEQEIDWWLQHRSADHLLIAWTGGEMIRDPDSGDYDWSKTDALPRRLVNIFKAEPNYSDLRFAKGATDLSLRNPRFLIEVAKLSSTLRGLPLDDLVGEDVRQHRKTRRLAQWTTVALALLTIAALGAALVARRERNIAEERRAESNRHQRIAEQEREQSRQRLVQVLVGNGERMVQQGDLSASLLWLVEALKLERGNPSGEQRQQFRIASVLRQHPTLRQIWFDESESSNSVAAAFSPDGRYILATSDGSARVWDTQSGAEVFPTFKRDNAPVADLVFSTVRKEFVTIDPENTVTKHDAQTGQKILSLRHEETVTSAALNPDGQRIATGSEDKMARVWDAQTGRELFSLAHDDAVNVVAFSRDARQVLTLSGAKTITVWDIETRKGVAMKNTQRAWAELSPDGERVLTTSTDGQAGLWSASSGEHLSGLGDWAWVDGAGFSPDGRQVVMVSRNGWAKVWDIADDKEIISVQHDGSVLAATFSPDGKQLATASTDQTARIWDTASGQSIGPSLNHGETVRSLAFELDGKHLVTATASGAVRLWDLRTSGTVTFKHTESVRTASFSKDARRLLTTTDSSAQLWDLESQTPVRLPLDSQLYSAALSPNSQRVVTASGNGKAELWDARTGALVRSLPHDRSVQFAQFSPDGQYLATASGTGVRIWETETGKLVHFLRHGAPVLRVQFDRNGGRLLAVDFEGVTRVWQVETGKEETFLEHRDVNQATFSPDGKRLATANETDFTVQVWDTASGTAVAQTIRHVGRIVSLAFSPDGTRLASSDAGSGTARVWNVATGAAITPPLQHAARVMHLSFSPEGDKLVTASADHTARVWDAATGAPLTRPLSHDDAVSSAEFSPDGHLIATASDDGKARIWNLTPENRPVNQLEAVSQILAARRIDATGAVVPLENASLRNLWISLQKLPSP